MVEWNNIFFIFSVYILTLVVLAIPDKQSVLLVWLLSCTVALVGHWAIYFISFRYFRSSLEELWVSQVFILNELWNPYKNTNYGFALYDITYPCTHIISATTCYLDNCLYGGVCSSFVLHTLH